MGNPQAEGPSLQSALPYLVEALLAGGDFKGQVDEKWLQDILDITKARTIKEPLVLALVRSVTLQMLKERPTQRLEFLAKQLRSSHSTKGQRVCDVRDRRYAGTPSLRGPCRVVDLNPRENLPSGREV